MIVMPCGVIGVNGMGIVDDIIQLLRRARGCWCHRWPGIKDSFASGLGRQPPMHHLLVIIGDENIPLAVIGAGQQRFHTCKTAQ